MRVVGSTAAASAEDVRRVLIGRATNPAQTPRAAQGLLAAAPTPACAESLRETASPVTVYRVALQPDGAGEIGEPECWKLPGFDTEVARRVAAVCLPSAAAVPDPVRTAVGSMYEPVVAALWRQVAAGGVSGDTLAALLSVARPAAEVPPRPA
jgi:hypothetical protein